MICNTVLLVTRALLAMLSRGGTVIKVSMLLREHAWPAPSQCMETEP